MQTHCPRSCGICTGPTTPAPRTTTFAPTPAPTPACADSPPSSWQEPCSTYIAYCDNPDYQTLMEKHCQNTCGKCSSGGGATPSPTKISGSTARCNALSQNSGKRENSLHVVMVPSGFRGDMQAFRREALRIYKVFSGYNPLDASSIDVLQVWYVDVDVDAGTGSCYFGDRTNSRCRSERLLCCDDVDKYAAHAARHCGSGKIMNTLIVHNSKEYGGAGYPWQATATVSVNEFSPQIGIHELGHSLFGLGDEYTVGGGNPDEDPNCDNVGCSKWSDLFGRPGVECKERKCRNGAYYGPGDTMMESFNWKFGEVNERISCCKYLYHTGITPRYCQKFNFGQLNLGSFCNTALWKGRYSNGVSMLQRNASLPLAPGSAEEDPQGARFVRVASPVAWTLRPAPASVGALQSGAQWTCTQSEEVLQDGYYLREMVEGDLVGSRDSSEPVADADVVVVEVLSRSGHVDRAIPFLLHMPLEVPFAPDRTDEAEAHVIFQRRDSITVVLHEGEECRVRSHA